MTDFKDKALDIAKAGGQEIVREGKDVAGFWKIDARAVVLIFVVGIVIGFIITKVV